MAACSSVEAVLRLISWEREQKKIDLDALKQSEREYFDQVAGLNWLGGAKVFVRTRVELDSTNQLVLAVCDQAFRNVPQKMFGEAPPTHAALILNRGVVLLPVEEFNRLNLDGFVNVRDLCSKTEAGVTALGEQP